MMEEKRLETLICTENLGRKSPELWPEPIPGVMEFAKELNVLHVNSQGTKPVGGAKFRTDLDADDIRCVNELGQMTPDQLMEHIKRLQNSAYQLGIEEAKQFSVGKILNVLEKS